MSFLVSNAEPETIRESPIFSDPEVWALCMNITQSTATWGDTDYTPVFNVVHTRIANHTSHQQQVEVTIKDISDQSQTGDASIIIHSTFSRPPNTAAQQRFPNVEQIARWLII